MNIKEEMPTFTLSVSSLDSYLESHMSNRNREVLEVLKELRDNELVDLYKTILFCIFHKEVPYREMICAHCVRELFNVIIRRNQKTLDVAKEGLYSVLCNASLIKNLDNISIQTIKDAVNIDIGKLFAASHHFKVANYLKTYRPKLNDDEILLHTRKVLSAKKKLEDLRHINDGKPTLIPEEDFLNYISDIEYFFLQMKETFLEQKDTIDEILARSNNC